MAFTLTSATLDQHLSSQTRAKRSGKSKVQSDLFALSDVFTFNISSFADEWLTQSPLEQKG